MQGGCQSEQNKNDAAGQSHIRERVTDKSSFFIEA